MHLASPRLEAWVKTKCGGRVWGVLNSIKNLSGEEKEFQKEGERRRKGGGLLDQDVIHYDT
jgi:hypothetical protein